MTEQGDQRAGYRAGLAGLGGTETTLLAMILVLSVGEGGARFLSPLYLSDQGTSLSAIGMSMSIFGAIAPVIPARSKPSFAAPKGASG